MAIADPFGRHSFPASGAVVRSEGHAPLWQYFLRPRNRKRRTSPLLLPKARTPGLHSLFLLQTRRFLGDRGKGPIRRLWTLGAPRLARAKAIPVVAVLPVSGKSQTSASLPPKGVNHGPAAFSPAKRPCSRGPRRRPSCGSWTPLAPSAASSRRDGGRRPSPLWQYFLRLLAKKADESIAAPKERQSWTPCSSTLQIGVSWGS